MGPHYQGFCETSGFPQKRAGLYPGFQVFWLLLGGIGAVKPLQILTGNSNSLFSSVVPINVILFLILELLSGKNIVPSSATSDPG